MDGRAIALAIPFFFLLIGIEALVDVRRRKRGEEPLYRFADAVTSLSCGVGQQVLAAALLGIIGLTAYAWLWEHARLFTVPTSSVLGWVAAFVLLDLCYYAYHRASHRVNFFWATHVVHHSSEEYNLATALRQSWFTGVTSWVFYVPLAILGFPLEMFVLSLTLDTLYQFWIHTRAIGKLGVAERVMNTPSHHRIHHAIDPEYIDKNYAGVFIVWDKMFGTFVEEGREPAYGTVKPLASFNPFWANLEGFARLWEMSSRTARWRDKLYVWLAPPEWQPADLGGPVTVPPVDPAREKYDVRTTPLLRAYVSASFAVVAAIVFAMLWWSTALGALEQAALAAVTLGALASWGALFEQKAWALPFELARLAAQAGVIAWVAGPTTLATPLTAAGALVTVASALVVWTIVARPSQAPARA